MTSQSFASRFWPALVIIAATVAAYHNTLHGPFVFDDASSIVTNPTIKKLWRLNEVLAGPSTNVTAQGRPLLNLSLAINYAIGGTAVEGYHLGNLLIHALAALTLFGIVRRTLLMRAANHATWFGLIVAVLWAVHPLQTESVTYIIQRAESLVGLFYLLTFYCFVRGLEFDPWSPVWDIRDVGDAPVPPHPRRAAGWLMLSVVCCFFGMATKEVMATAPLMLLFFDRTFFAGTFVEAWRRRRRFYLGLAGTWLFLAWLVAQTGGNRGGSVGFGVGIAPWQYWLTQFKAIAHYLWLAVWPHPLVFEYGVFWIRSAGEVAGAMAVVLVLLVTTVVGLWRRSTLGFLGAWFFGILAPTSLAPGTTQMIVEHRMYLPLAAVIAAMVGAAHSLLSERRQSWLRWLFPGAAMAWLLLTVGRNVDYRSDLALWTDTLAKRPNNPLAHFMLGGAQERAGQLAPARASYERTLALKPEFSMGHEHLGELLLRQGQRAEAIAHFERALQLQPEYADAYANLGNACLAEGWTDEAVANLEKAAELAPDAPMTRYNFGNALVAAGRPAEAVTQYEAVLKLQPAMAEAHFNLANVLLELRRTPEAIAHYEAALKARAGYAAAHYNLANALAASGRQTEAVAHYEAALRAQPDYPEAHHNLGSALFELGRLPEAAQHYEATLRLAPDFPSARANLERVRARMK